MNLGAGMQPPEKGYRRYPEHDTESEQNEAYHEIGDKPSKVIVLRLYRHA